MTLFHFATAPWIRHRQTANQHRRSAKARDKTSCYIMQSFRGGSLEMHTAARGMSKIIANPHTEVALNEDLWSWR